MRKEQRHLEVAIIGAGLAGLSAGVALAKAGTRVELFERSSALGGRAASRLVGDYVLDLGPHALYANGAARCGLASLGVSVQGRAPRPRAAAKLGGRYHQLPMGPASLLSTRLLGFADKLRLAKVLSELQSSACEARLRALDPEVTVAQWIAARVPPGRGRLLLETLVRLSNYSGHPGQRASVAINQLRMAVTGGVLYLDGGWRSLVDSLEHELSGRGRIHKGCKVTSLRRLEDCRVPSWELGFGDGRSLTAEQVVLAVSPAVARRLLEAGGRGLPQATALAKLPSAPLASHAACLQVALDPVTSGKFDLILGLDQPVYLSVFSQTAEVGPRGSEVIHVMRYVDHGEAPSDTRSELEALLDVARPGWRDRVCEASYQPRLCTNNWIETASLPRPDAELASGLFAAGDWVSVDGVLADAAVGSALEVSRRVLEQRKSAQARAASVFAAPAATGELWS